MEPKYHDLPASDSTRYAELLNVAATIDQFAEAQHLSGNIRAALSFITNHRLFDADPAIEEDYSDLLPNPPEDPTAWRGAQFRRQRNAAVTGDAIAGDFSTGAAPDLGAVISIRPLAGRRD